MDNLFLIKITYVIMIKKQFDNYILYLCYNKFIELYALQSKHVKTLIR